ncbi:hypothetical protein FRC19_005953 [Serendipita sp. 401]|nr:hypothetical protein FRC19_005953 [Serendipita sp. 401]
MHMDYDLEIQKLEEQIEQSVTRRAELVKEINNHISFFVKQSSQTRLFLPDDILIIIFRSLLFSNPGCIGHLLFVCRQWYSVIMNTPILWSAIDLTPSNNLNSLLLWTAYCRACIQRSASSPLQISINYHEVVEPRCIAAAAIYSAWTMVGIKARTPSFLKSFCHAVPSYTATHFARFEAPIRVLMGRDCEEVPRWQALTLDGGIWIYRILSLIRRGSGDEPLPKRRFFWDSRIVCRFSAAASKQHDRRGPDKTINTLFPSNPPPLRYLSIPLVLPLGLIDPYSVQEMDAYCHRPRGISYVLWFRQLRSLVLTATSRSQLDSKKGEVYFPLLVELEVRSYLPDPFWEYLDAPRLETLRVESCDYLPRIFNTLPEVRCLELGFPFTYVRGV